MFIFRLIDLRLNSGYRACAGTSDADPGTGRKFMARFARMLDDSCVRFLRTDERAACTMG